MIVFFITFEVTFMSRINICLAYIRELVNAGKQGLPPYMTEGFLSGTLNKKMNRQLYLLYLLNMSTSHLAQTFELGFHDSKPAVVCSTGV